MPRANNQLLARRTDREADFASPGSLALLWTIWAAAEALALGAGFTSGNPGLMRARCTIWVATLFAMPSFWIPLLGPTGRYWRWLSRWCWTLAALAYAVHFWVAAFDVLGGSVSRIYMHQGPTVATFNLMITGVWIFDATIVTWWRWDHPLRVQRITSILVHTAVMVGFFVSELTVRRGFATLLGAILFAGIAVGLVSRLILLWRPQRTLVDWIRAQAQGSVYLERRLRTDFSPGQLYRQALDDLVAKEVQTGYSTTYVWMANQLGHFTLGFVPVLLSFWLGSWIFGDSLSSFGPVIPAVAAFIVIRKEWIDYVKDVDRAKEANGYFRVDRGDLLLDAGTAVLFMLMGVVVGYAAQFAMRGQNAVLVGALIGVLILAFGPAGYWLRRKKCFQMAALPFVYRICDFGPTITREDAHRIKQFIELRVDAPRHLVVYGPEGSGKTSLITGIGSEHAFQMGKARFTTLFELLQIAPLEKEPATQTNRDLWSWREVNLLLIDDVDAGLEDASLVSPAEVVKAFRNRGLNVLNALRRARTVWVLGVSACPKEWRRALATILACPEASIEFIELSADRAARNGARPPCLEAEPNASTGRPPAQATHVRHG